jgi:hypothetical protein
LDARCWTYLGPANARVLAVAVIDGSLWIGVDGRGILRYDPSAGQWLQQSFPRKSVHAIARSRGIIWATVSGTAFPDTTLSYLYMSADGGDTWEPRDGGFAAQQQYYSEVGPLALDSSNSSKLLLGLPIGVAESDDAGVSWRQVRDTRSTVLSYDALTVSPISGTRVWAGGANMAAGNQFAQRSDNGGTTWTIVHQPGDSGHGTVPAFLPSRTNTDRVLASIWGSVQVTDDGGASWRTSLQMAHPGRYVLGFAVTSTEVIAVSTEETGTVDGVLGLYTAPSDAGPWTSVATPPDAAGGLAVVVMDPGSWIVATARGVWVARP